MTDPARAKHLPVLEENPRELAEEQIEPLADVVSIREKRDLLRSRRKREVRAVTINVNRMAKRELELGRLLFPDDGGHEERPKTRAECAGIERPCPFVSCAHHLYLDVSAKTGAIKLNFPDLEPGEMPPNASCALDVADRGGETLEHVGEILNMTRERVRQIEVAAVAKAADRAPSQLRELADVEGRAGGRGSLRDEEPEGEDERPELEDDDQELAPGPVGELVAEFDVETFMALEDAGPGQPPEAA